MSCEDWETHRSRFDVFNVLMGHLDRQDKAELSVDVGVVLQRTRPNHWLPFCRRSGPDRLARFSCRAIIAGRQHPYRRDSGRAGPHGPGRFCRSDRRPRCAWNKRFSSARPRPVIEQAYRDGLAGSAEIIRRYLQAHRPLKEALMNILVTGGAGYIGSITSQTLLAAGHRVTVYDNLVKGHRAAVPEGARFVQGAVGDRPALDEVLDSESFDAVLHFAAYIEAGESMVDPGRYFENNTCASHTLIQAAVAHQVPRFVLSSTAAVYAGKDTPITEDDPIQPANAYGQTKLMIEQMLDWYRRIHGLHFAALRYFNACGATPGRGEAHSPETHLIPLTLQVPLGSARGHQSLWRRLPHPRRLHSAGRTRTPMTFPCPPGAGPTTRTRVRCRFRKTSFSPATVSTDWSTPRPNPIQRICSDSILWTASGIRNCSTVT